MNGRRAGTGRRAQRGQGLLLVMLALLVAGAAVLLEGIGGRASNRVGDDEGTTRALALAKEALIAYAVLDANRPGELPCPDANRDGIIVIGTDTAGSNCAVLRGWLPWRTLDMEDVRDGAGEPLWYAVADAFHANGTTPINPDTAGGLTVDSAGAADIVAVIIAPGEARGGQSRPAEPPGGAPDASTHAVQYLEGVNADADLDTYAASGGADFNDRVVYITAQELMRAVEQRVLGEVAAALWDYRDANGAYPWLSPFADPIADPDAFDGVPGTRIGHLAFTDASDIGSSQDTGYTIIWDANDVPVEVVGADTLLSGGFLLDAASALLMQNSAAADAAAGSYTFDLPSAPTGGNPSCDWQGSDAVADCVGVAPVESAGYQVIVSLPLCCGLPPLVLSLQVNRQYSFDVAYTGAAVPDALEGARVRNVASGATFQSFPDATAVSTVTVRHYIPILPAISITRRLTIRDESVSGVAQNATLDVNGIYLEPAAGGAVLRGDLPAWFHDNLWHRFALVKLAGNALPTESLSQGTACTPGGDCVRVDIVDRTGTVGATLNDRHAVVIGAGAQIGAQNRVVGADQTHYFEESNASLSDAVAERRVWRSAWVFNDQVRPVLQPF